MKWLVVVLLLTSRFAVAEPTLDGAIPDDSFDIAVRAALATRNADLALEQVKTRTSLKSAAVIEAELALFANAPDAVTKIESACHEPGNDYACFLLEDAIARRTPMTVATTRMERDAMRAIDTFERTSIGGYDGIELIATQPIGFRNYVGAALRGVTRRCASKADKNMWVWVRVKFGEGKLGSVDVHDTGELQSCLRSELPRLMPSSAPADLTASLAVEIALPRVGVVVMAARAALHAADVDSRPRLVTERVKRSALRASAYDDQHVSSSFFAPTGRSTSAIHSLRCHA